MVPTLKQLTQMNEVEVYVRSIWTIIGKKKSSTMGCRDACSILEQNIFERELLLYSWGWGGVCGQGGDQFNLVHCYQGHIGLRDRDIANTANVKGVYGEVEGADARESGEVEHYPEDF